MDSLMGFPEIQAKWETQFANLESFEVIFWATWFTIESVV